MTQDFWIDVTDGCNLECTYCYQKNRNHHMMIESTADKVIDAIVGYNDIEKCKVIFFGGEPFLNIDIIVYIVNKLNQYLKDKVSYSVTTNLTILNKEIAQFLADNQFHVMISMDGDKDTFNKNRRTDRNADYFDTVYKNVFIIKEYEQIQFCFSKVVTENNYMQLYKDVLFLCQFSEVVFLNFDMKDELFLDGNSELYAELDKIIAYWFQKRKEGNPVKIDFVENHAAEFSNLFIAQKGIGHQSCSTPDEILYAFDTEGKVYPCHYFIENYGCYGCDSIEEVKQTVRNTACLCKVDDKYEALRTRFEKMKCKACEYKVRCYEDYVDLLDNFCHLNCYKVNTKSTELRKERDDVVCSRKYTFDTFFSLLNAEEVALDDFIQS